MRAQKTPGELAFEEYLHGQHVAFEYEPPLSFTKKLVDYVVDHPTRGKIYFEVKDINCPPLPISFSQFDPYLPIRKHIEEGKAKFKDFSDQFCVLVLFNAPGSFADIMQPDFMLGAMYGNFGFTIPVNVETGVADDSRVETRFLPGEGKMVRSTQYRNTRIAALISLVAYNTFTKEAPRCVAADDGRTTEERWDDVLPGRTAISHDPMLCCTVWENCTAKRRLPQDLFRGPMDAWWTCDGDRQGPTFIGQKRRALGIDDRYL